MLRGVRRGCVRGDFRCGQFWVGLQVIGDELDDCAGCNRRLEGGAVTKRMPGAPVLKSSLIGARRVAGGALLEEGRDRFSSFVGETIRVFQPRRGLDSGRQGLHVGDSVGGAGYLFNLLF
jgi:hypothetical protein